MAYSGESPAALSRGVARIDLERISPGACQPRRSFSEETVAELAASIQRYGLLSPLIVRRVGAGRYELIAGERRMRALKLLGQRQADAIVLSAYDQDCALIALIENIQRENLHYLEEAEACREIMNRQGLTQEELARAIGRSPSAVANHLRLLKLSPAVRDLLRGAPLTERHARALLKLPDAPAQLEAAQAAASRALSVRQLEELVSRMESRSREKRPDPKIRCRDARMVVNALMDTVRQIRRLGVAADARVVENGGSVDVIVTIRTVGAAGGNPGN